MDRLETAPLRTPYKSLYAKLGVPTGASTEAIRRAYRVLEDAYQPGGAYVDDVMHLAFTEISRAASILGNPKTRTLYDLGYIDEFGKPTKAGVARASRARSAIFASALITIGLAGLAVFTIGHSNPPAETAGNVNPPAQHVFQPVPAPRPPDQMPKSVSNDKPAPQAPDGAAPLQTDARDYLPLETRDGPGDHTGHVSRESPGEPKRPRLAVAPRSRPLQGAPLRPGERRTSNPERRRTARLSRTGPELLQSYIWFGAPAPASRPIGASQTLKTAHCLACLTDHQADCSRVCP